MLQETQKLERQEGVKRKVVFFILDAGSQGRWWTAVPRNAVFPELRIIEGFYRPTS